MINLEFSLVGFPSLAGLFLQRAFEGLYSVILWPWHPLKKLAKMAEKIVKKSENPGLNPCVGWR
jgi:hypothetical protein